MKVEPLAKSIYDRLTKMGVEKLKLAFSGGDDEGYLTVYIDDEPLDYRERLNSIIEDWAFSTYRYSGAGDGTRYGDDVVYDLKNMTASSQEWFTVESKEFCEEDNSNLKLDESK